MTVLMTGHKGYIGSVMAPMFRSAGHTVIGLENYLYEGCTLGAWPTGNLTRWIMRGIPTPTRTWRRLTHSTCCHVSGTTCIPPNSTNLSNTRPITR